MLHTPIMRPVFLKIINEDKTCMLRYLVPNFFSQKILQTNLKSVFNFLEEKNVNFKI